MEDREGGGGRRLLLAAGLLGGLAALAAARLSPPAPAGADAPASAFSAGRARERLREILGGGAPHPVGSDAAARVRERILAALRSAGYLPEVQESFACGRYGICARVRNVLARLDGRRAGRAVLVAAHYDSVPAGPGAADDGAGVAAALEIARALRAGPPPERPVMLLLDDGEEGGLIGAEAFAREHAWAREVGAVVNLEARGTGGPSLLFETTGGSAFVAGLFARSAVRPVATSLFAGVYGLLPNDTDLTVLRALGAPGANLAFIAEAERYHTRADDLAHLDPGSLQQQGENALGLVRAFARSNLERPPRGDAVFFDLVGLAVVAWPAEAAVPLAAAAAVLALAGAALGARRGAGSRRVLAGLGAFAAGPAAAAIGAAAVRLGLLAAGAQPTPWVAHPGLAVAACWCAGAAGAGAAALLSRGLGRGALRAGAALGWSLLGLGAAIAFPAGSHAAAVPALATGAVALAAAGCRPGGLAADALSVLAALAAGAVLFPIAWLLPDAVGLPAGPLVAALVALAASPLLPLAEGIGERGCRAAALAPAAAGLAAAAAAALAPHASPERPRQVRVVFHEDADSARARWLVLSADGRLPAAMGRAGVFAPLADGAFPWMPGPRAFAAEAPAAAGPGPELRVLESTRDGTRRVVRARLRSLRGAADVMLWFPPGAPLEAVAMDGREVPATDRRIERLVGGHRLVRCLTAPPDGVEIRLVISGEDPVSVDVADQTPGVPAGGERLLAARPPDSVGFQDGDTTVFTRRVKL